MVWNHGTSLASPQLPEKKKNNGFKAHDCVGHNGFFMGQNSLSGSKLLLVVDDKEHQAHISKLLETLDIGTYALAEGGVEALQLLDSFQPDIALVDLDLQNGNGGFQVAKAIKSESDIPIILLTSNLDSGAFNEAKKLRPHAFLDWQLDSLKLGQSIELALLHNAELRHFRREAEQFSFVASHDLKEPIRAITSFATLLERELKEKLSGNAKAYLHYIKQGGQRMNSLIVGILENAIVNNKRCQYLEPVDLNDALADAVRFAQTDFGGKLVQIEANCLPAVATDPVLIEFVFKRLLHNALKFNDSPIPLVKVCGEVSKNWVKISFADNGIGIGQEHREKIFDMFVKLHPKDKYEGAGLGLFHSQKAMAALGGEIGFSSKLGIGSEFWVTFPLAK